MLNFQLVTPARLEREESVHMVVIPGAEGDFGVLEGHAPLLSTIRDGDLSIYRSDGAAPERLHIEGGLAQVSESGLTVLADRIATASD